MLCFPEEGAFLRKDRIEGFAVEEVDLGPISFSSPISVFHNDELSPPGDNQPRIAYIGCAYTFSGSRVIITKPSLNRDEVLEEVQNAVRILMNEMEGDLH